MSTNNEHPLCSESESEDIDTLVDKMNNLSDTLLNIGNQSSLTTHRNSQSTKRKPGRPKRTQDLPKNEMSILIEQIQILSQQVSHFANKLDHMEETFGKMYKELKEDNANLKRENLALKSELGRITNRMDDLEQRNVNNKVIIHMKNFKPLPNKSLKESVIGTLDSHLPLERNALVDIKISNFGNVENKFVLDLPNQQTKRLLFKTIKTKKPNDIYIYEFLIKKRHQLLYELRQLKRNDDGLFHSVYSFNGIIYVKYSRDSQPVSINDIREIQMTRRSRSRE